MSLSEQLSELMREMTNIRTEVDELRAETTLLSEARTRLAALQEIDGKLLAKRQDELVHARQVETEISHSISDLTDLISKLDKEAAEKGINERPNSGTSK